MQKKVMIVDDDDSIRDIVTRILNKAEIPVCSAGSGSECLDLLEEGFTGLILMDIVMPGMDGWDVVKEIVDRKLIENIIICMLTGNEEPDEKMNPLKEYVLDYIRKPFKYGGLISIVNEYLSFIEE